ncbi:zinc finger protein 184-like [Pomacea canaliculata]|uniref:zinc finger protein 184-like n=1 Tax=Pomacea canaliculata TaxID=400727 RepID=UPI000D735DD1|nr:zinc finger protein 184-like [Pomacea canaliculata]
MAALQELSKVQDMLDSEHGSAVKLEFSTQNTSEVKSGEKPALGENPEWLHMVKTETQSFTDNKKQHAEFASVVKTERKLQDICVKMEQNLGHAESTEQPAAASSKSKIHSCKEVNTAIKMEQEVGNHRYMKVDNIKLEGSLEQQDNQRQLSQVVPSCKIEAVTMCLNLVTAQKISGTKCRMNILRDSDQHQQQTCCDLSEVMDGVTLNVFIDVANSDFNQNEIKCLESDTENDLDVSCEKSHAEEDCHLQVTLGQKRDTDFLEHMAIHSDLRTHRCSQCRSAFRTHSDLKDHMLVHSSVKSHQCDLCQAAFKRSKHLTQHMLVHTELFRHLTPRFPVVSELPYLTKDIDCANTNSVAAGADILLAVCDADKDLK